MPAFFAILPNNMRIVERLNLLPSSFTHKAGLLSCLRRKYFFNALPDLIPMKTTRRRLFFCARGFHGNRTREIVQIIYVHCAELGRSGAGIDQA